MRQLVVQVVLAEVVLNQMVLVKQEHLVKDTRAEPVQSLATVVVEEEELAQLVEQPIKQLEAKDGPWIWRDWLVSPEDAGRWRLQRRAGGSGES